MESIYVISYKFKAYTICMDSSQQLNKITMLKDTFNLKSMQYTRFRVLLRAPCNELYVVHTVWLMQ